MRSKALLPQLLFALLPLFIVVLLPSKSFAQDETTSAILGQVTDSSGAVIPGATVTIANRDTGLKRVVRTDAAGRTCRRRHALPPQAEAPL